MTEALLNWFDTHKRKLPWRSARSPYRVWISEVMLQQTQVATVIPYFERWMARFETVEALAQAPLDEVLKAWEGLGYYRRVRNLHKAAQHIAGRGGLFPDHYEGWLELPGIGPYTAAAIASIVQGEAVVAVDGNVKRVTARLFALPEVSEKEARSRLQPLLAKEQPGEFNEAMMELGATICTPKHPQCERCPLRTECQAYQLERVQEFPAPKAKKQVPHHYRYAHIYLKGQNLWLRQRGTEEMLGGLWGFVLSDEQPKGATLEPVQHAYTHFRVTVTPVFVARKPGGAQPVKLEAVQDHALSTLDHKVLAKLIRYEQAQKARKPTRYARAHE